MFDNFFSLWTNREELRIFLGKHPYLGPILFIVFQALQVIIAPIPGEATGFLAGFFFGAFKGCLISTTGIIVGSSFAFYIGRFFKKRILSRYEDSSRYLKIKKIFKKYGITGTFFLYLFPGFPKDILNYFLGVMPISFKAFIFICTLGRIPGTFALSLQGDVVYGGHPYKIFIVFTIFGLAFVIFFLFKKRLTI
uniref:TVP38/TMEM64 family membrane protein n=1 Tax=Thermodesulfobacterium geofontis TaxID=1295609 RepID=A0A7V4N565_9BACT